MSRRRVWQLGAVLVVVAAAVVLSLPADEPGPSARARALAAELLDKPPGLGARWLIRFHLVKHEEAREREAVENDLVALGRPAVPALVPLLEDEDADVRRAAIRTLGRIGVKEPASWRALIWALADAETHVESAVAVARIDPDSAPPQVAATLTRGLLEIDPYYPPAWSDYTEALAGIGPAALPRLIRALDAGKCDRDAFADVVRLMGPAAREARPLTVRPWDVEDLSFPSLFGVPDAMGLGAVELVAVLEPPGAPWMDPPGNWLLVGTPKTVARVAEFLHDAWPPVREWAANTLGSVRPVLPAAAEALGAALEDEDANVAAAAARALSKLGVHGRSQVPRLIRLLEHPQADRRLSAAGALIAVGTAGDARRTLRPLVRELHAEADDFGGYVRPRERALELLGRLGTPARGAVPDVVSVLRENVGPDLCAAAAEALLSIDRRTAVRVALPVLLKQLKMYWENHEPCPAAIFRAVGAFGPSAGDAVPALLQRLSQEPSSLARRQAAAAVALVRVDRAAAAKCDAALADLMVQLSKVPPPFVPKLGVLGVRARDVVEFMGEATDLLSLEVVPSAPDDGAASAEAAAALRRLGRAAVPVLMSKVRDREMFDNGVAAAAARLLAEMGAPGVHALLRLTGHHDREIRGRAVVALRYVRPGELGRAVRELVRIIGDESESHVFLAAVDSLSVVAPSAGVRDVEVVGPLVELLGQESRSLRVAAAEALAALGPEGIEALPALRRALRDPHWRVRYSALLALGRMGPAAEPDLLGALNDEDYWMRMAAVDGLARRAAARPEVAAALRRMLDDPAPQVRVEAARALIRARADVRGEAGGALVALVGSRNMWVQLRAMDGLGEVSPRPAGAVEAVASATRASAPTVRWSAVATLGRWRAASPEAVQALAFAVGDSEPGTSAKAIYVLGELGPDAAAGVPALVRILPDGYERVRWALVRIGAAAIPAVADLLAGRSDDARYGAIQVLAGIGAPAVPAVCRVLRHRDASVRISAAHCLGRMGRKAKAAVPDLIGVLSDRSMWVRQAAVNALGDIGPASHPATGAILDLVREDAVAESDARRSLEEIGATAVPGLAAYANDRDYTVRTLAVQLLMRLGPGSAEAVPALIKALGHRDAAHRERAAWALGRIGPGAGEAVSALVRLLDAKEFGTCRLAAARALGRIGPTARGALPALRRLIKDENNILREAAGTAIEAIESRGD